ncbi:MAG TPA: hypothetical protein VHA11_02850, partial [Bryobacteraceae bacterium]|nr:hypothetical protein [Bryobacteraceae bacterium]
MKTLVVLLAASVFQPEVPKTWEDSAVASLEVPLANPRYSPAHLSFEAYYRIPARVLYRTYPVYAPGREPAGYAEWLKHQEPQVVFDPAQLKTREDWIKAGELVFNAPTSFSPVFFSAADVRNPAFFEQTGMPVAKDGTIPFARWVVRKKGEVELGSMGCNTCHTRVMPDGSVVPGAQGNNPGDRQGARMLRNAMRFLGPEKTLARLTGFARQFEMP